MRIVAGKHRGRSLTPPADRRIRPTSDRMRQTLFDILAHADWSPLAADPEGVVVLDACCGTGALGLEALSRGAGSVVFLDQDRRSLALARHNAQSLGELDRCRFVVGDAARPPSPSAVADLVFLDPPYHQGLVVPMLLGLTTAGWLADAALAVVETEDTAPAVPSGFVLLNDRHQGDSRLWFLRRLPS